MTDYSPVDNNDGRRDIPDSRRFELDNGNEVIISKEGNPYGFFSVRFKTGGTPDSLKGKFTNYQDAVIAWQKYLEAKNDKRYTEVKLKKTTKKKKQELFEETNDAS